MKIYKDIIQRSDEWHNLRHGKITGTGLSRVCGSKTKKDTFYYEYLAQRLSTESLSTENAMQRGIRLEDEAIEKFETETGILTEKVGFCQSDENKFIGISPDRLIKKNGKYEESVEVKCLSSGNHVKIWLTNEIPAEYMFQCMQYFIVNKETQKHYFVSYDPRITVHPLHIIEIKREDIEEHLKFCEEQQIEFLEKVDNKLNEILKL